MTDQHTHLSIQLRLDGFSFCVLEKYSEKYLDIQNFEMDAHTNTPQKQLDFIVDKFKEYPILTKGHQTLAITHTNKLTTLVPKPLFSKENLSDYLQYNLKVLENDFITYDEIQNSEMINVYIPFVHINNFLFEQFGSFEYKHSSTVLIELLLAKYKNSTNIDFFVNVEYDFFQIIILKEKKLLFFNSFSFKTKEDFIYYILFTAEQLQLNPEDFKLIFLGAIEKESELYDIVYKYVRNIAFLEIDTTIDKSLNISKHAHSILLNQHL